MLINGKQVSVPPGASITMVNNVIFINGVRWEGEENGSFKQSILIRLEGEVVDLHTDNAAEIVGNVTGDVDAGNSCTVYGNVQGNVKAGNSIDCRNIGGNAKAGNSITRR